MRIPPTAAIVDMTVSTNASWSDALQFGILGDTSWDFNNKTFKLQVKASRDDVSPLLTVTSPVEIVVDDPVARVLHFNVPPGSIALSVGEYVYDLLMTDTVTGIVTMLMLGRLFVTLGVTED